MNGNLEFIYDALLVPLTAALKEVFNEQLSAQFSVQFKNMINDALDNNWQITFTDGVSEKGPGGPYNGDVRWLDVQVNSNFITAFQTNQMLKKDPQNDQILHKWMEVTFYPTPKIATNDQFQYLIQLGVFQSCLNAYLDLTNQLTNQFSNQQVDSWVDKKIDQQADRWIGKDKWVDRQADKQVGKPPTRQATQPLSLKALKFVRTGLLVEATHQNFGAQFLVTISPESFKANSFVNDTRWVMNFKLLNSVGDTGRAQELGRDMQEKRYQIVAAAQMTNSVESARCKVIYHSDFWMHMGCNVYG